MLPPQQVGRLTAMFGSALARASETEAAPWWLINMIASRTG